LNPWRLDRIARAGVVALDLAAPWTPIQGFRQLSSLLDERFSAAELPAQAASRIPGAMAARRMY
jgi:hypothetical protein